MRFRKPGEHLPFIYLFPGQWDFSSNICKLNSIINIGIWMEHIIMFALLKADKILATALPIGKYPLISVDKVTVIVKLSWLISLSVSILVNSLYPCSYEPAVVLCIPLLPIGFFITVFSCFCVLFVFIVICFLSSIFYLKKAGQMNLNYKSTV